MHQLGPSVRAEATQGTTGLLAGTHRCQTGLLEAESRRTMTGRIEAEPMSVGRSSNEDPVNASLSWENGLPACP